MSQAKPVRSESYDEEKTSPDSKPSGEIILDEGKIGERQETEIGILDAWAS